MIRWSASANRGGKVATPRPDTHTETDKTDSTGKREGETTENMREKEGTTDPDTHMVISNVENKVDTCFRGIQ